jgi:glycosyltransferase involved in cell wall biosynthesis
MNFAVKLMTSLDRSDCRAATESFHPSGADPASGDRPIRVLMATPDMSRPGGVSQYLRVLRRHLRDSVRYITIGKRSEGERADRAVWRLALDSWRFAQALKNGAYDIVHLNPSFLPRALIRDGILLLISKARRKTAIVFVHGWDDSFEGALSAHFARLFRFVYNRADAFIVLSEEFKLKLRRLGYEKNVFVQGAPVEDELLENCQPTPQNHGHGRRNSFNILFLARVEKEKGIYEALEAYRLLKQRYPFVSLMVAGDGSELPGAVRYACAQKLPDISFSGHVEHAAKYEIFQNADAYLLPSYNEGLPISVLEAMACGLPVITRAVGGLRDFFRDGEMGFITESRNPEVFASLICRLIRNPALCSSISRLNRTYARDQFTGPRVAASLERIYRSVLASAD